MNTRTCPARRPAQPRRSDVADTLAPVAVLAVLTLAAVVAALLVASVTFGAAAAAAPALPGAWLAAAVAVGGALWALDVSGRVGDSDRVKKPSAINWLAEMA